MLVLVAGGEDSRVLAQLDHHRERTGRGALELLPDRRRKHHGGGPLLQVQNQCERGHRADSGVLGLVLRRDSQHDTGNPVA